MARAACGYGSKACFQKNLLLYWKEKNRQNYQPSIIHSTKGRHHFRQNFAGLHALPWRFPACGALGRSAKPGTGKWKAGEGGRQRAVVLHDFWFMFDVLFLLIVDNSCLFLLMFFPYVFLIVFWRFFLNYVFHVVSVCFCSFCYSSDKCSHLSLFPKVDQKLLEPRVQRQQLPIWPRNLDGFSHVFNVLSYFDHLWHSCVLHQSYSNIKTTKCRVPEAGDAICSAQPPLSLLQYSDSRSLCNSSNFYDVSIYVYDQKKPGFGRFYLFAFWGCWLAGF